MERTGVFARVQLPQDQNTHQLLLREHQNFEHHSRSNTETRSMYDDKNIHYGAESYYPRA